MAGMNPDRRPGAVAIGASAGAVQALSTILPALPADFALPIFVVVHVPPARANALAPLFAERCSLRVREAEDKEPVCGGTVYLAPPDYHLLVETQGSLSLSKDEPVCHSRPSIDVLFESAADAYGDGLTGIVLTGANQDGAKGLEAVLERGGRGIVQDPAEAQASAMPEAAIRACPQADVMSLAEIAVRLGGLDKA